MPSKTLLKFSALLLLFSVFLIAACTSLVLGKSAFRWDEQLGIEATHAAATSVATKATEATATDMAPADTMATHGAADKSAETLLGHGTVSGAKLKESIVEIKDLIIRSKHPEKNRNKLENTSEEESAGNGDVESYFTISQPLEIICLALSGRNDIVIKADNEILVQTKVKNSKISEVRGNFTPKTPGNHVVSCGSGTSSLSKHLSVSTK